MRQPDLPERWRVRIANHAIQTSGGKYRSLGLRNFGKNHVELAFPDGSTALFRYAFVLEDREADEIGVFTEHCGYHVFPLTDTTVRTFEE